MVRHGMKRTLLTIFIVVAIAAPVFAGVRIQNFKRGLKTFITAPAQVSDNLEEETKNAPFFPFAFAGGLLKGIFYMGQKLVIGTIEMASSPLQENVFPKTP